MKSCSSLAAGIADLGQIGPDIARQIGAARRPHDVAGKARAAALTVGDEFGAVAASPVIRAGSLRGSFGAGGEARLASVLNLDSSRVGQPG